MKIKMLVMDVDGTLTDGHIYMGPDGETMKAFSCKDGSFICRFPVSSMYSTLQVQLQLPWIGRITSTDECICSLYWSGVAAYHTRMVVSS